jgi:hypothetical protein
LAIIIPFKNHYSILRAPKKTTKDEDRINRMNMKEKAKVSSSFFYPVYPVNPVYYSISQSPRLHGFCYRLLGKDVKGSAGF